MGGERARRRTTRAVVPALLVLVLVGCGSTVAPQGDSAGQAAPGTSADGVVPADSGLTVAPVPGSSPTVGGGSLGGSESLVTDSTPFTTGTGADQRSRAGATTYAAHPRTGRGWDATSNYIRFGIESDVSTAGKALGVDSLDFGDMKAMDNALIHYVNARGGLFGRKLVPVFYDANTARGLSNPDEVAQEACSSWTEDRPVAVITITSPLLATHTLFRCAAQHDTPVIAHSLFAFTEPDVGHLQRYLTLIDNIAFERLVPPWVQRLTALGYFRGWNTATGAPGAAPTKVGIIHQSLPWADHAFAKLINALKAQQIEVSDVITYHDISDAAVQSAVLKLRQDGVTHVFLDFYAAVTFPTNAEQQGYRPRYAVNTQEEIDAFLAGNAPPRQLNGALGIGWIPASDVDMPQDPHASPGAPRCQKIMRDAGVALNSRQAYLEAMLDCDLTLLAVASAVAGGGLATPDLARGIAITAPRFSYAAIFGATADPAPVGNAGAFRSLGFAASCGCFRYLDAHNSTM